MTKVSVIVPVYNVEKYLEECLGSIRRQSLKDIEIICVDDGSTDTSLQILEKQAAEDSRIKVLKQKNQGAGVARNYGLSIAQGDYVAFLDSDDIFDADLLANTVKTAEEQQADIVVYRFRIYDQDKESYRRADYAFKKEFWPNGVFSYKDNPDKIFNSFNPCAWNKLFRREFVIQAGIQFQANKRTNDMFFTEAAMVLAGRIFALDQELMSYRAGTASNSQAKKNSEASIDFYKALLGVQALLEEQQLLTIVSKSFQKLVQDTFLHNMKNNSAKGSMQIAELWLKQGQEQLKVQPSQEMQPYLDSYYGYSFRKKKELDSAPRECTLLHKAETKQTPKVSVIIPVYNVEEYLEECLESISRQSLEEIEIICVDDGSTDNSAKVLAKYLEEELRITHVYQNNGGLSQARNTGVSFATGKYLYFIDSDDFLKAEALERLYYKAEEQKLDVLYFDADSFFESEDLIAANKGYMEYYHRTGDYSQTVSGRELFVAMMKKREYRTSVPLHFISRNYYISSGLTSINGILHEDNAFAFECMLKAERVAHLKESFYQRRVRADSIVTRAKRFAHVYGYFRCLQAMLECMKGMEFSSEEKIYVDRLFTTTKDSVYKIYQSLSDKEKSVLNSLDEYEKYMFSLLVLDIPLGKQQVVPARNVDGGKQNQKSKVKPTGKLDKVIQCYKDNGLKYTLFKIKQKLLK